MNDAEMRAYISKLYNGARWRRRVRRMPEDQVFAIYTKAKQKEAEQTKDKPDKEEPEDEIPF